MRPAGHPGPQGVSSVRYRASPQFGTHGFLQTFLRAALALYCLLQAIFNEPVFLQAAGRNALRHTAARRTTTYATKRLSPCPQRPPHAACRAPWPARRIQRALQGITTTCPVAHPPPASQTGPCVASPNTARLLSPAQRESPPDSKRCTPASTAADAWQYPRRHCPPARPLACRLADVLRAAALRVAPLLLPTPWGAGQYPAGSSPAAGFRRS